MTTVHADNASESLRRIETLLREAGRLPDREAIAEFVRVVVFLRYDRDTGKRVVDEIVRVVGIDEDGRYRLESPVW